jgi:phenylacetate-CoA ligase
MLNIIADKISKHFTPGQLAWLYTKAPPMLAAGLALHRFRATVRWAAAHSAFYRRAFAEHGINPAKVRTPADLGDFYTTPNDIVANVKEFICAPPSIVFESSGTSGKNKQVYYSQAEMLEMGKSTAAGLRLMGVTPQDRVANAFDFSIWIPGMIAHYGLMAAGNFCLAFGKVDPIEVYRRIDLHGFNVVLGEPTWLIRLTELAEKHGPKKLKMLMGGAEEMPVKAIPWMRDVWGGAQVKMCYGSVEQGSGIGFQPCDHANGYHLDTVDFLPEVIEPDANGYGELVFTTLQRRVMPLIRYRTRDVTRLSTDRCPCGLVAPRISKLRGRRDELIVASGGNLYPLMFENILRPIRGITHDWQVIFRLDGIREVLELNVESTRSDHQALRSEIFAQATEQYPDLMKNLALGIFDWPIEIHEPGIIRKGRKLKRLLDQRHFDGPPAPLHDPIEQELSAASR